MTDLSPDDLKALLAAASPGPWDVYLWHQADTIEIWDITTVTTTVAECQWCHDDAVAADVVRANARLIALAPALAAEVIRLRAGCFALAAGACSGHYGDDHGHSRCSLVDVQRTRAEAAEAVLREVGEMLLIVASSLEEEIEARRAGELPRRIERDLAEVAAARDLAAKIRGRG